MTSTGGEEMEKMIIENYGKVWWEERKDEVVKGNWAGGAWMEWETLYDGKRNVENVRGDTQKRKLGPRA